jgi:hypothetical protein
MTLSKMTQYRINSRMKLCSLFAVLMFRSHYIVFVPQIVTLMSAVLPDVVAPTASIHNTSFPLQLMNWPNKLECLPVAIISSLL